MFYSRRSARTASPSLLVFIMFIWLLTACGGQAEPTPVPVAVEPPTISEPKISAPTPQEPGQEIGISVDVSSASGASLTYAWRVDGGEIVRGQGSPAITYRTPEEPGIYNVRVAVMWDDSSVEKITTIRVEAPAVVSADELPTDTPTPEPTDAPPTATAPPPTSTLEPTATLVPATATPAPTNTPRPTPIPTATIDADPTVYDNFNNPAFDGSFNQGQWDIWSAPPNYITQQAGILTISQEGKLNTWTTLFPRKYNDIFIDAPTYFETKIKLDPTKNVGRAILWIEFRLLPDRALTACSINENIDAYCEYVDNSGDSWDERYQTEYQSVGDGQFHTVRIEIEPSSMTFVYVLDGQVIGSYTPNDAEKFKGMAKFYPAIGVANWGKDSTEAVVGHFDDVRIGQLGQ